MGNPKSGIYRRPEKGRLIDPEDVRQRLAERDAREAADTRTEAQRWLGDPPADRSALAQSSHQDLTPQ